MRHRFGLRSFGQHGIVSDSNRVSSSPAVYHNLDKDVIVGRRRRLKCLEHRCQGSQTKPQVTAYKVYARGAERDMLP